MLYRYAIYPIYTIMIYTVCLHGVVEYSYSVYVLLYSVTSISVLKYISHSTSSRTGDTAYTAYTGGTANVTDMIIYSVVGVSVLLAVLGLASGITFGVALWRRVRKRKGESPQRQGELPQRRGEPSQRQREPPQRQGEPSQRQREPQQRRGEPPQRWGEPPQRRGEPPQRQGEPPQRRWEPQEMNGTIQIGRTAEEDYSNDYSYEYVNDESSTDGRVALYQELVAGTQDYLSVYNQLNGKTYQELDLQGREHEHHYQKANQWRERHGGRK